MLSSRSPHHGDFHSLFHVRNVLDKFGSSGYLKRFVEGENDEVLEAM